MTVSPSQNHQRQKLLFFTTTGINSPAIGELNSATPWHRPSAGAAASPEWHAYGPYCGQPQIGPSAWRNTTLRILMFLSTTFARSLATEWIRSTLNTPLDDLGAESPSDNRAGTHFHDLCPAAHRLTASSVHSRDYNKVGNSSDCGRWATSGIFIGTMGQGFINKQMAGRARMASSTCRLRTPFLDQPLEPPFTRTLRGHP